MKYIKNSKYLECGYIEGDSDKDTRVVCRKKKWKKLVEKLRERGLAQTDKPEGWEFFYGSIPVAIERSDKVGSIIFDTGQRWDVMPLYKTFDTVEYRGKKYNLPSPIEEYLERRYGKNWKHPDPTWDKHGGHEA